jgi:hypothetical protein
MEGGCTHNLVDVICVGKPLLLAFDFLEMNVCPNLLVLAGRINIACREYIHVTIWCLTLDDSNTV